MKILQVTPTVRGEMDGPGCAALSLSIHLASIGHKTHLHVLTPFSEASSGKARVFVHPRGPLFYRRGFSPAMAHALQSEAVDTHLLHSHGLWMMPAIYCAMLRRDFELRLVVSPRGTLSAEALKYSALQKWFFWKLLQKNAVARADLLHATSEKERAEIRSAGFRQPIAVIPNGVDVPPTLERPKLKPSRVLFLGRLHPIKGLEPLIRAWTELQDRFPQWELYLVGPSENGYGEYLQSLAKSLGAARIVFGGPTSGSQKSCLLATASLGVFPSFTENFGIAIAETLAHGTPVLVSDNTPWATEVGPRQCGWATSLKALTESLGQVLSHPPQSLEAAGQAGRAWLAQDFAWSTLAQRFARTYEWLVKGGSTPDWVETLEGKRTFNAVGSTHLGNSPQTPQKYSSK